MNKEQQQQGGYLKQALKEAPNQAMKQASKQALKGQQAVQWTLSDSVYRTGTTTMSPDHTDRYRSISGHQPYIDSSAHMYIFLNQLWITIGCPLGKSPRDTQYELRVCTWTHNAAYSGFTLLLMQELSAHEIEFNSSLRCPLIFCQVFL